MLSKYNFFKSLKKTSKGMSMLELMLYIGITSVLILGIMQLFRTLNDRSKRTTSENVVRMTKSGVDQFKIDLGRYPTKLDELLKSPADQAEKRRWQGPYIAEDMARDGSIRDGYGNELEYKFDSSTQKIEVFSWGKKGPGSDEGNIVAE
jgi:general secretion pathway protein G